LEVRQLTAGLAGGDCVSATGPTAAPLSFDLGGELETTDDLVKVMGWYVRRGWALHNYTSSPSGAFEMLPRRSRHIDLLAFRLEVREHLRLSHSDDHGTRLDWGVRVAACPSLRAGP
jgi:hypothetical protein